MNLNRNGKIARSPDRWGGDGGSNHGRKESPQIQPNRGKWRTGQPAAQAAVKACQTASSHFSRYRGLPPDFRGLERAICGNFSTCLSIAKRRRTKVFVSMPCLRPIQPTATNNRPITSSPASDVATTFAGCCSRGRPRSDMDTWTARTGPRFFAQVRRAQAPRKLGDTSASFWNCNPNRASFPSASVECQTKKNKVDQGQSR
jgi:hypothetical protein